MTLRSPIRMAFASVLFVLLAAQAMPAWAARAWLDRGEVEMGETVTLNVQGEAGASAPDFSVLGGDFELRGQSSQSSVQMVNGTTTSSTLWAVVLAPREAGLFTIPAFDLGSAQTDPVQLKVLPPSPQADSHSGDDIFLEVEAEPRNPYVQQQVPVTVRLYYAVTLLEGQLDEPVAEGAEFSRVGNDSSYQKTIGGRRYNVVERRYLMLPERSGPLNVPGVRFRGRAAVQGRYGFGFGSGRTANAHSEAMQFDVRPQPPGIDPWLPASALEWTDNRGNLPASVKVGEPLTLERKLSVQGMAADQLPEPTLPEIDGASVYPDQSERKDGAQSGLPASSIQRKFAIVPTRPGTLTIPGETLSWWDTTSDQARTASLPPRQITVLSADGTATGGNTTTANAGVGDAGSAPAVAETSAVDEAGARTSANPGFWRPLAIAFAVLWVLTMLLLLWVWRRGRKPAAEFPAPPKPFAAPDARPLNDALKGGELVEIDRALRSLLGEPGHPLPSLAAVIERLDDAGQIDGVRALDAARFGSGSAQAALAVLRRSFAKPPVRRKAAVSSRTDDPLPPLYPPHR